MSKGERIEAYVRSLGLDGSEYDPCYLAYFGCFNAQDYYEAHDVLEHLWLGVRDGDYAFYKGLIQLAGAFVHLKKQHARPWHPKDGRRMHPAVRLFALAEGNLLPYGRSHLGLDLDEVLALIHRHVGAIKESDYTRNPWIPEDAPVLKVPGSGKRKVAVP